MEKEHGHTKSHISLLAAYEKQKIIWGMETTRRDLSNGTNPNFVTLAV